MKKEIIKETQARIIPHIIERDIQIPTDTNKIISLFGARRSGKTFILFSIGKMAKKKK